MEWIDHVKNKAEESWAYAGHVQCYIVKTDMGHYCGYVLFPKRPLQEETYGGIATYVPVHGGITLAHETPYGFCYGFDCNHAGDEANPQLQDLDWLRQETEKLAQCIALAADGYETAYLEAANNQERGAVIDAYHERLSELGVADFELTDNFGAMLNLLGGKI